jgi:hypothetical protein
MVKLMKICQTCNRTYDDDTLSFCLYDGSILITGSTDSAPTRRIPAAQSTEPFAQNALPYGSAQSPPAPAPPQLQYGAWAQPQQRGSGRLWWTIGGIAALLLVVAGVGLGIVLIRSDWFGRDSSAGRSNDNERNSYRSRNRSAAASATPEQAPAPTPQVSVAEKLGLIGTWSGAQNQRPASLRITSGEGNSFTGIKYQGDNEVSFAGTINPATRQVTMTETKLLKGIPYANGKGWSLATETGSLSADGRKLSGKGIDEYNRKTPYSWSYTKK